MKKYFLLALVVLTGIASSCKYDDDEIWDSVNDLANRVSALEEATKQLNSDIAALQSIVSALQNQVSVSKVETLVDGYIIHFSDGTKATIKNGEDGKDGKDGLNAPIINVAKEGGVYYWTITIDGETEWLTDESGNKMPVSGEDGKDGANGATGKDGNTPLLQVNSEGYWEVSYDNGKTYVLVNKEEGGVLADGEDGKDGKDGLNAPIINVAKEGGVYYWTITIDGETEWLTDESGNKMPVSGEDGKDGANGATGKDGNTPLLQVNSEGYWEVSYDNGETYDLVDKPNGIKAEGKDGDSKFDAQNPVEEKDGYIVITMADGETKYELPLLAAVSYLVGGMEIDTKNELVFTERNSMDLIYKVPQLGSNFSVEVLKQEGVTVVVDENNKKLAITYVGETSELKAVILFYNANQTITSVLKFRKD